MRLRWWETLALLPLLLGASLFYASGRWVGATVIVAVAAFAAASRVHIVERNVAGFHARMRGAALLVRASALLAVYCLIVYGFFVMQHGHWTDDRHGLVAYYATIGLAIFLLRDIRQLGNEADRYLRGWEMESAVADQLDPLRDDGWTIVHNVLRDDAGGNVDHYAAAPGGPAFAIETKSGKLRASDRGQAISNAIWAKDKFGVRFVTAILCVGTEPPEQPTLVHHTPRSDVWVVGVHQLAQHLRSRA